MKTSESTKDIATALARAQGEMKAAIKDSENPHFRSRYATLAAVWDACRLPLSTNNIAVLQSVESPPDGVSVTTRLVHSSGEWIEFGPLIIPLDKQTAQSIGSGTSYARRYGLAAAVGITSEDDDDGNAATASPPAKGSERTLNPASRPAIDRNVVDRQVAYDKQKAAAAARDLFKTILAKAVFIGNITVAGTLLDPAIKLDTPSALATRRKLIGDLLKTDAENIYTASMSAGEWDICSRELQQVIDGRLPLEAS